jgi:small-conductance mechanosensitive channel
VASIRRLDWFLLKRASMRVGHSIHTRGKIMNNIIYIVGLVVVVLFILGFFGLR